MIEPCCHTIRSRTHHYLPQPHSLPQVTSVLGLPNSIVDPGWMSTRSRFPHVTTVDGLPSSMVDPGLTSTRSRLPQVVSDPGVPKSISGSDSCLLPHVISVDGLPNSMVDPSGLEMIRSRLFHVVSLEGVPRSIVVPGLVMMRSRFPHVTTVEGAPSSIVEPGVESVSCGWGGLVDASLLGSSMCGSFSWTYGGQSGCCGSECEEGVAHGRL